MAECVAHPKTRSGDVEDTAQQEQATSDPDELPDLVLDEPRIQHLNRRQQQQVPPLQERQKRKKKRKVTRRLQRSIR